MERITQVQKEIIEKCIKERRSIRVFRDREVEAGKLMEVLEAGNWAPSAGNFQSRRFIVIQGQEERKNVMECIHSAQISKSGKANMMKAPVFIIVCAHPKKCRERYAGRKSLLFSIQDATTAAQNMTLMAYALGLGTCWIGNFDESAIISRFGLKDGLYPVAILALGYPEFIPLPPKRYDIEEITVFYPEYKVGESVYKP